MTIITDRNGVDWRLVWVWCDHCGAERPHHGPYCMSCGTDRTETT